MNIGKYDVVYFDSGHKQFRTADFSNVGGSYSFKFNPIIYMKIKDESI